MKVRVQATKLEEAKASFISLVGAGANRVPFRIVKNDKGNENMIDLGKVFKGAKNAPAAPAIAAFASPKGEASEIVKAAIAKAGFKAEPLEQEQGVLFAQVENFDAEKTVAFKMDGDAVAFVTGISLPDALKGEGPVASVAESVTKMNEAITAAAGDPDKIAEAASVHKAFVAARKSVVPEGVTKAETEIVAAKKAADEAKAKATKEAEDKAAQEKATKEAAEKAQKEAEEKARKEAEAKAAEATQKNEKQTISAEDVAKIVKESVEAALKPVSEKVEAVSKQVSDVAKAQETASAKLSEVETVAKAAQSAVKGITVGGKPAGEELPNGGENGEPVRKSADPISGCFDTAFLPRGSIQKRARMSRVAG